MTWLTAAKRGQGQDAAKRGQGQDGRQEGGGIRAEAGAGTGLLGLPDWAASGQGGGATS